MKRNWLGQGLLVTGLVASGLLGVVACGGDKNDDDNMGGARSVDSSDDIDELRDQIAALQAQLDAAGEDERAALQDELDGLQAQLDDLLAPGCGEGGECTGLDTAIEALTPVVEAACSAVFDCCSPGEMRMAMGPTIDSAQDCEDALLSRASSGVGIEELDYAARGLGLATDLPDLASLATALDNGRVELDLEAIDACVADLEAAGCPGDDGEGCEGYVDTSCTVDDFVIGLVEEGGECESDSAYAGCESDLTCVGADGDMMYLKLGGGSTGSGSCQDVSIEGRSCLSDDECGYYGSGEMYCNITTGTCTIAGDVGDDCSWTDPTWNEYWNTGLEKCKAGLTCNPFTDVCEAYCSDTSSCYSDRDCPTGFGCDAQDYGYYRNGNYGSCVALTADGGDCQYDSDCKSDECYGGSCRAECDAWGTDGCATGEFCDDDNCYEQYGTGGYCYYGYQCESGACVGNNCAPTPTEDAACTEASEEGSTACLPSQYCNGTTCVDIIATDNACTDSYQCGADAFCDADSSDSCQPAGLARGADCSGAVDADYEPYDGDCERGACAEGLSCVVYYADTLSNLGYVCLPEEFHDFEPVLEEGEYCGTGAGERTGNRCLEGRCRFVEDGSHTVCDAGVEVGGACEPIGEDHHFRDTDCVLGAYCHDQGDGTGICEAQVPSGALCEPEYDDGGWIYGQCAGFTECELYDDLWRCPVEDSLDDVECPISDGGKSIVIDPREL